MPIDPFENFLFYLQLDFLEQMKFVSVRAEKETKEKYSSLFSVKLKCQLEWKFVILCYKNAIH